MKAPRLFILALCAAWTFGVVTAAGDTSAVSLSAALSKLGDGGARYLRLSQGSSRANLLVRSESSAAARKLGLIPITESVAVGSRSQTAWNELSAQTGVTSVLVASRRFPLLDEASKTVRLSQAQNGSGLRGEGAIVGIVDTGIDASHPAVRHADGTTRISWLLAFGKEPRGVHPELEAEYGCEELECAVYSAADLNEILASNVLSELPKDPIGHGTHITSIAAGADDDYPGIAPLADLVVVAAADELGGVDDARILLGTKFVFDRAAESNQPAVVNISLGSSFGAHDGTSEVEKGLAELGSGEGRAVVIAAGNSGSVVDTFSSDYPGPLGIHNEVAVLRSSATRVPVITPPQPGGNDSEGSFFIWISTDPGDNLSVGFHNGRGEETDLIGPGSVGGINSKKLDDPDDYDIVILNGNDDQLEADVLPGSVVVAVVGTWQSGRVFELVLKGTATARLWITGTGDVSAGANGMGPLLPRARIAGTVSVPGSHEALITVGSTVNRTEWTDYSGGVVGSAPTDDPRSYFSAAGPNQGGALKPELVAPGEGVIAAMAAEADPRTSLTSLSQFASGGACPDEIECFVIDDDHGLASGTSMAAPLVTGTIALLMQRDPSITMEVAKRYLMAGTREVPDQPLGSLVGTGELDVVGALLAQERDLAPDGSTVDAASSRVIWADGYVHPAPGRALQGYLLMRDANDAPAPVDASELDVSVAGPGAAHVEVVSLGLARITVQADAGSAGQELYVNTQIGGQSVEAQTFLIERDATLAAYGFELTGGTCSQGGGIRGGAPLSPLSALLSLCLLGLFARRHQRAPH